VRTALNLAGTKYAVDRDYPPEVRTAWIQLWPAYKSTENNCSNRVHLKYPAALIVNDRVMEDDFPCWDKIMSTNTKPQTDNDHCITVTSTVSNLSHS
jgi:hypothetical protein